MAVRLTNPTVVILNVPVGASVAAIVIRVDLGGETTYFAGFDRCREEEWMWTTKQHVSSVFEGSWTHKK